MRRLPAFALTLAFSFALVGPAELAGADSDRPPAPFCPALARVDSVGSPGGPQGPTPAAMRAWGRKVAHSMRTMNRNAPSKLKPHTGRMVIAMDAAVRGEVDALDGEAGKARDRVEAYAYDNCGWRRLNVTGRDYKFVNVPEVLPLGANIVRLRNKGDEFHVLVWQRRRANDRRSPGHALSEDWGRLMANNTPARARALGFLTNETPAAPPDGTGYATATLTRGRYIVFCPVHVEDGNGEAHFARGMWDALEAR